MPDYPAAPRADDADILHGITVPDPYRRLEDATAPDTEAWVAAQADLLGAWWAADPRRRETRDRFAARVRELLPGFVSAPAVRGVNRFFTQRHPEQDHAVLVVATPEGQRTLIDPSELSPDHTTTLDGWWPSGDGRLLAYTLSEGGAEEDVVRVMDVASGTVVDGPIMGGRAVDLAWSGNGEGFFYVRRLPDDMIPEDESQFHRRVWWHRVGRPVDEDVMVFGDGRDKTTYYGLETSHDGRWLTVVASLGTAPRNDLYVAEIGDPVDPRAIQWRTAQEGVDARSYGSVGHDGSLYVYSDLDAPRGRLMVADPRSPDSAYWRELLPETDAVLGGFALTNDALVVTRTRNVVAEVDVHDLASGTRRGSLDLPGLGAAMVSTRPGGGRDVWVSYTDHLTPFRVLHGEIDGDQLPVLHTWAEPPGASAAGNVTASARQVWVTSPDGTQVPMFVIAGADTGLPRPTVLYGYGGFNVALDPAYSAVSTAWVEAGGVWAIANLRGGSEFGEEWHRDGMRANKQHVFEDFAACARWLVDAGRTTPSQLGIYGGSNGGLLVGAALTRDPDLYGAVVCSAPLLDMVRYEQFGLGVTWNDEYGTVADADELGWLLAYSPYHHVTEGTRYPATLFTVFDSDTRVDPLHARKMAAALQGATGAAFDEAPILFRREANVGHSTRSVGRTIDLNAEILAFLADQLGLG